MQNTFVSSTAQHIRLSPAENWNNLFPAGASLDTVTTVSSALLPPSGRTGVLSHALTLNTSQNSLQAIILR